MRHRYLMMVAAALMTSLASEGRAQASPAVGTSGTYTIASGSYRIDVEFTPGKLTVIEPNKRSEYTQNPQNPREYLFRNPTNQLRYGIRVLDVTTIEAFQPVTGAPPPTRLTLVKGLDSDFRGATNDRYAEIAETYRKKSESDPDNAHLWTACAAAAFARTTMASSEADEYAEQVAALLRPIMVNATQSPCVDAIPNHLWGGRH